MATAFNMCHKKDIGWERAKKGEYETWLEATKKKRQRYKVASERAIKIGNMPIVDSIIIIPLHNTYDIVKVTAILRSIFFTC